MLAIHYTVFKPFFFLKFFSLIQFYLFHLCITYDRTCSREQVHVLTWKPVVKTGRLQLLLTVLFEGL